MKLKSSEPFWMVKNGMINSYPSLKENISTEILIVGGGITGSLIAHQCIEEGYKTVLVDRREVAHGSTSASTSFLQFEIDVPLFELIDKIGEKGANDSYWACYRAVDKLGKVVKKVKSDCGYQTKDSLYFAAYKKDVPWLKKEFEVRKAHGFPVVWLDPKDLEKKFRLKNSYGGILSAKGAGVDAFKLTHDLLLYNSKRGLNVFDKTELDKAKYIGEEVCFRTQEGFSISAQKVIYCTGYESVDMINETFVDLKSTYAVVGEQINDYPSVLKNTLFWNTAKPYLYLRITEDNRLLIGGGDEEFVNPAKRDLLLSKKALILEKDLKKYLPTYEYRTDFTWAGTFGETKDGLPYIGEHPEFPNSFFVLAFGGNGITFSTIGMEMVSDYLKNRKHYLSNWFGFGR